MNSSPNILYVITDLEIGGVPLHLSRLATAMRGRGYRPTVVSLAPAGPVGKMLTEAGVSVNSCGGCCGMDFRVLPRLGEIVDEIRPDLIHSFLFHANQATRLVAALSGYPTRSIICEIQTVEVERRWHLYVDRWTHTLCRWTVGNSASVIEHLHKNARISMDRLQVVPGGIDISRIDSAEPASNRGFIFGDRGGGGANELATGSNHRIVLWVGRLDPVKGLDGLLHALKCIVPSHPETCLLLVGDGSDRVRLESMVRALQLGKHVSFLGPRSDVPSLLKIADLFVFPSRTEGLPNALLEAMAAGRPIVATDVPGCRDLITHEGNGLLVPYGDTSALASAMMRLLDDRELAGCLGRHARNDVALRWSVQHTWDAYEQLYRTALAVH